MADLNTEAQDTTKPRGSGPLVIIGCGNLNRSDDGVGVCVVHRLRSLHLPHWPEGVALYDAGTAGMEVMFKARGAAALVVVDACVSGSEPGAVFRLPGSEIDTEHQPSYSLHDFRWDHAIYAGRRIYGTQFPQDLTVFLVEAATVALGTELSPAVASAVDKVCSQIDSHVREWCNSITR